MVTQLQLAHKCGIDVSSVNKILHRVPGPSFKKETIRNVFKVARELGYDLGRLKHTHRRRHPRQEVDCAIEMTIYRPDGSVFSSGQAIVREISLSGAVLKGIVLSKQVIPIDPHTIGLRFPSGPGGTLEVRGFPVRFFHDGEALGLSVEFVKADGVRKWIRMIS